MTGYGTPRCPVLLSDRAAYHHASEAGQTVMESETQGKAADEVRKLYKWMYRQIDMAAPRPRKSA